MLNANGRMSLGTSTFSITGANVNLELGQGGNTQISMNDTVARSLANVTGNYTPIKFSDFYFKYVPTTASKFLVPGNYTFTVPPNVTQITVSYQTTTGYVSTNANVTPGQVIPVTIGSSGSSGRFGTINIPAYDINIVNWSGGIDDQFGVELGVTAQSYSVYLSTMRGGSGSVSYLNTISVPNSAVNPLEAYYSAHSGRNWYNSSIAQHPNAGNGWKARAYMYDGDRSASGYSFTLAVRKVVDVTVNWSPAPTIYNIVVTGNYGSLNPLDVLNNWTNWNYTPNCQINIIIKSGSVLYGLPGSYAFYSGTGWPTGTTITVVNYGSIIGYGGSGGKSASYDWYTGAQTSTAGSNGGPAIGAAVPITIYNYGIISGGGGGGGAGGQILYYYYAVYASGGGGGGGAANGTGGASAQSDWGNSNAGGNGAMLTGGAGGSPVFDAYGGHGGSGGAGGSYGQPGVAGSPAYISPQDQSYSYGLLAGEATAAGSAGAAINGNGNINWAVTGTIIGAIL